VSREMDVVRLGGDEYDALVDERDRLRAEVAALAAKDAEIATLECQAGFALVRAETAEARAELAEQEAMGLREMVDSTKVAAWDKCAEIIRRAQAAEAERDALRDVLEEVLADAEESISICPLTKAKARAVLEGKS
jgi:hypothetical protein